MAQINKPSEYFNTVTYTGDGSASRSITGTGFQPDFVWIKNRDSVFEHNLFDVIRGAGKLLESSTSDPELTVTTRLLSFDSDGFTTGANSNTNENTKKIVAWNWLAGGTASSNTDGSITSSVSANTTSGFSIVSYSGNSTGGATVGHSLGATPSLIIVKDRTTSSYHWQVYHKSLGATKALQLSLTDAEITGINRWNNTEPTSSVFTLGSSLNLNGTGQDYIAYCFAEKKGFSKFGSFTGNGNADGTFVYTGFKPAFIIEKRSDAVGSWLIYDNKRLGYNGGNNYFYADGSDTEFTTQLIDITSNGFKHRFAGGANGGESIYMAFAESPLVGTNNIPATAR